MRKRNLIPLSLLLIFSLVLIYSLVLSGNQTNNASTIEKSINVQVHNVEKCQVEESIAYSGTIEESKSIPLSFSVTGNVSRVLASEGDFVRKGQLLAVLDEATMRNAYEMSAASLKQAEDAYKRLKPMYENGNLPEIKFIEVETGLQQAKAATAISKKNLDDCNLFSPTSGFVGSRSIEPGMNAISGFTVFNIVKIEKVYAKVSISENEIALISKGQEAIITVGALGSKKYKGSIEEIGVMADPIAHTYKIKIGIPNEKKLIKPGMICEVKIPKLNASESIIVPNQAVQVDEEGKTFVFSVDVNQKRAERKFIKTGRLLNRGIEITEGLNKGEMVVISGQQKLVNDSLVNIVNR